MSKRSNKLLLEDILESAQKIQKVTSDKTFESFTTDVILADSILRNFTVIGEAANKLEDEFKQINNNLNWNRIIGLRNRIVHEYFGIDLNTIWNIVKTYIPALIIDIEQLIKKH